LNIPNKLPVSDIGRESRYLAALQSLQQLAIMQLVRTVIPRRENVTSLSVSGLLFRFTVTFDVFPLSFNVTF
jgi:hypothetical protein